MHNIEMKFGRSPKIGYANGIWDLRAERTRNGRVYAWEAFERYGSGYLRQRTLKHLSSALQKWADDHKAKEQPK